MFQIKINIKIAINVKKKTYYRKQMSDQFINKHNLERYFYRNVILMFNLSKSLQNQQYHRK